jgi:hypothetical protein
MKKLLLFLSLILTVCSCNTDDDNSLSNTTELHQFTPDQADWSVFYSNPISQGHLSHDPDGWRKFKLSDWDKAKWDGKTTYNPSKMTRAEFGEAICPDVDMVRGIRELFYKVKPFKDNENPTKAEVDEWHRISINHIRSLVGYNDEASKIEKDSCLFIRALWGDQRKHTKIWEDAGYPAGNSSNIHYGASFIPNKEDQQPYFADDNNDCRAVGGAEGIFVRARTHIPWSTKWIRPFCMSLQREGFWGGHMGPWYHRSKFGFSFWDNNADNKKSYALLRAKWGGKLRPNKFPKP